jgi:hypothetical protein
MNQNTALIAAAAGVAAYFLWKSRTTTVIAPSTSAPAGAPPVRNAALVFSQPANVTLLQRLTPPPSPGTQPTPPPTTGRGIGQQAGGAIGAAGAAAGCAAVPGVGGLAAPFCGAAGGYLGAQAGGYVGNKVEQGINYLKGLF